MCRGEPAVPFHLPSNLQLPWNDDYSCNINVVNTLAESDLLNTTRRIL